METPYVTKLEAMVTETNSRTKAQREAKAQKDARERQLRRRDSIRCQARVIPTYA